MKKLTAYNLACGCVQVFKTKVTKIEMYMEHQAYHVREFGLFVDGRYIQENWLVFDTFKDATKCFNRLIQITKARA
jgi:putative heme degradation protein